MSIYSPSKMIPRTLALLCLLLIFVASASSTNSTYSSGTITVNGIKNLSQISSDINDSNILSKSGNEYILTANLTINTSATLFIDGSILKFNGASHNLYGINNKGILNISNSTITSNTNYAWWIDNPNVAWYLNQNPTLNINNVDMSKCGYGTKYCIEIGKFDDPTVSVKQFIWSNLSIHDSLGGRIISNGYAGTKVNISNSNFYNLTSRIIDGTQTIIRNSTFYNINISNGGYVIISWGLNGSVYSISEEMLKN